MITVRDREMKTHAILFSWCIDLVKRKEIGKLVGREGGQIGTRRKLWLLKLIENKDKKHCRFLSVTSTWITFNSFCWTTPFYKMYYKHTNCDAYALVWVLIEKVTAFLWSLSKLSRKELKNKIYIYLTTTVLTVRVCVFLKIWFNKIIKWITLSIYTR